MTRSTDDPVSGAFSSGRADRSARSMEPIAKNDWRFAGAASMFGVRSFHRLSFKKRHRMAIGSNGLWNTRIAVSRKVFVSSMLLRVGIAGVALAVWAAASVASAETSVATAIAALLAGVAIAVLSLRRAWSLLEQDSDTEALAQRTAARKRSHIATTIAGAAR
jgi:hypothetical protein